MITMILPVLDEPKINVFIDGLTLALDCIGEEYEIIVVTGDKESLHTSLNHGVRHYKSYGDSLERSILLGFTVAQGDKLIVMDADGSHPVDALPCMVEKLSEVDLVVGSRFLAGSVFSQSLLRKLVSYTYIRIAKLLGSKLRDPMSGFFGFKRGLLNGVRFRPVTWKTCLELELATDAVVGEVPICFGRRVAGVSKTSAKVGVCLLWDMLCLGVGL